MTADLAGTLEVRFTVQPRGNVTDVDVVSNTSCSTELADCVIGVIERFRFNPGPEGGAVVYVYPFVFAPQA